MIDISLIIQLIIFLFALILCFTIPGTFFLERLTQKLSFWEKFILSTGLGFTFFTLLSYFLMVLKVHFLLLPIILLIDFLTFKNFVISLKRISFLPSKKNFLVLLIFATGILGQMAIIAPSGSLLDGDLVFWSSHAHDGSWHIALMEQLKKGDRKSVV